MSPNKPVIFTIGLYGFDEERFFGKLKEHSIDTFVDIRNRRGVRGSKYRFGNSAYLQKRLDKLGIRYIHVRALAPSTDIRSIQKQIDQQDRVLKRARRELSTEFVRAYERQILASFDFEDFLESLPEDTRCQAPDCTGIARGHRKVGRRGGCSKTTCLSKGG